MRPTLLEMVRPLERVTSRQAAPEKSRCLANIPLDFAAKASIAVGVDGLLPWSPPRLALFAGLVVVQAARQARCGDGERGYGHQASQ
jgi:hypothetical protein